MLINDITEFRTVYPISKEADYDSLKPALIQGQGSLIDIMGANEYIALNTAYNSASLTPDQNEIIYYAQMHKVFYGLYKHLPSLHVMLSDMGTSELSDSAGTVSPVRMWSYNKLSQSLAEKADAAADGLLKTMESMPGSFPDWEASESYTKYHDHFINSTEEFNQHVNIRSSRTTWMRIRPYVNSAEQKHILGILCQDLFDELKAQIAARTLTALNEKLMSFIRPATASLTLMEAIPNINVWVGENGIVARMGADDNPKEKASNTQVAELIKYHEGNAEFWLNRLRSHLYDNLSDYPLYASSDCHSNNPVPNEIIDNSNRRSFFVK